MRPVARIISSIGSLSGKWMLPEYYFRKKAVKMLERESGFSEKMAHKMIDALFAQLSAAKLRRLLESELGDPKALDGFVADKKNRRYIRANGPAIILHIFAGNSPGAAVMSFVLGLLVKSRNVGKLSSHDRGFLEVYLNSLKKHDKQLWSQCSIISGKGPRFSKVLKNAELVVAYGADQTINDIRRELPVKKRFVGYGHRFSFSLYTREVLMSRNLPRLARATALDIWMADQRGCLSSSILFAQKNGKVSPEEFSEIIAWELSRLERTDRRGPRRNLAEILSAKSAADKIVIDRIKGDSSPRWESETPGRWSVKYNEKIKKVSASAYQRFTVCGFKKFSEVEAALSSSKENLQGAALECAPAQRLKIAHWLSVIGVNRICRAGKLQYPPVTWHHDGCLNLANWLNFTDLEV